MHWGVSYAVQFRRWQMQWSMSTMAVVDSFGISLRLIGLRFTLSWPYTCMRIFMIKGLISFTLSSCERDDIIYKVDLALPSVPILARFNPPTIGNGAIFGSNGDRWNSQSWLSRVAIVEVKRWKVNSLGSNYALLPMTKLTQGYGRIIFLASFKTEGPYRERGTIYAYYHLLASGSQWDSRYPGLWICLFPKKRNYTG